MPKLTKTLVDSLKKPDTGDAWAWDSEVEGFGVRIQASGRKTYVVRYRTNDSKRVQRKLTIGRCSDFPPEKAREKARKVFSDVADGMDPAQERKVNANASVTSVENMFKAYVASMRLKNRISADEVERALLLAENNAADALGRTKAASSITPSDVVKFVATFYTRGKRSSADKARSYITSAYNWAIKSANDYTVLNRQDWGIVRNPGTDVAKDSGATTARDRNLDADDLRLLWAATHQRECHFAPDTGAVVRVLISCGQRVMETLRIDGSEIDLVAKVWNMPAHKTKTKKYPHTIPLPDVIIETFKQLKEKHGDGPLFPGRADDEPLMKSASVNQALRRWQTMEGVDVERFQTRDLRRTWKSRSHDAGIDRFVRDLIQQHAKNDTGSKHYDRADYLPQMREAMVKWGVWLEAAVNPPTAEGLALAA